MTEPTFDDKATGRKAGRPDPLAREYKAFPDLVGPLVCRLCGEAGQGVKTSVRNVKDGERGRGGFRAFPCCQDRLACRNRRESQGKVWPLIDATKPLGREERMEAHDGQ